MNVGRKQAVTLWLIGVIAAAQLAKFAVLAPVLRSRFDLSITMVGLLVSLLEIGGALFGFVAGMAIGKVGARRILSLGLFTLAIARLVEALAPDVPTIFAARAAEGMGYLFVVISAPTLIFAVSEERDRASALALWSTFVPVGLAVGSAATGIAFSQLGADGTMALWATISIAALVLAQRLPSRRQTVERRIALPTLSAWMSTFGFGFYTAFVCALLMLLPTFLIEKTGASIEGASVAVGIVSFATLPGTAIAIYLLRDGRLNRRRSLTITIPSLTVAAVLVPLVFWIGSNGEFIACAAVALCVATLGGIATSVVFGRLPALARARSPTDPRVASTNGLLTQFGAGGALIGPPCGGVVVNYWGWNGLGAALAGVALASTAILLLAEAVSGGTVAPEER